MYGAWRVAEQGSTVTLPDVSDVCHDPCTFMSVCSWWCVETCSLTVISNAMISGEWQSGLPVAFCHPKHAPSRPAPTRRKAKASSQGLKGQRFDGLKLNFIGQVPAYVYENVCMLLKPPRPGLNKKTTSRIICMTPPVLWNFKEPLPACAFLGEKQRRSACPL